ncbi:MAG: ABC transporter permease [Elusimicrobia bacterium]|nr:ABC transporter permease [Elusimicrobiota bacterium]
MKLIELNNISKTYYLGSIDVPVLHGVSLTVKEGEFISIMGPSGSGKSTLLHILGLLDKPSGGSYNLLTHEISQLTDSQLATVRNKFIGFIFQSFNLLPRMSATENVLMPLVYSDNKKKNMENSRQNAIKLLQRVGLGDRTQHKSNELSGGQQQRVAIARALINNPLIIFADEPTGNLDSKSAAEIIDILKELNDSGITIIMVTHEPDLAQAAKRIIKLQDGKIIADEINHKSKASVQQPDEEMEIPKIHHNVFKISRVGDYFSQAMRALMSNKTRSFLSILGVLIGVTGLIAMLALGKGAREATKQQMASLGSNILMVSPGSSHRQGVSLGAGAVTRFTLEDAQSIRKDVDGVTGVAAYANGRGQIIYNGKNWNTRIESTSPDYQFMKNAKPTIGRFFTEEENTSRAKVAVIGQTIVTQLFGNQNPLGEFIKINRVDFQVIGILPVKGASGWRDEDDKVEVPVNTAMHRLFGKAFIDSMDVQVADETIMDDVSKKITDRILFLHRLPKDRADSINIRNLADIQATVNATMKIFSTLLGSVAFISLLVGGIGIMNIMLVSVTERTREIGLRKAVGANNSDILFQFVIESIFICVMGGVIGIMLGSAISVSLAVFAHWKTIVSLSSIVVSFTFSVVIGLIFGTWPAKKASQLNPIEALRYE